MSPDGKPRGVRDERDLVAPQTVRAVEELIAAVPELRGAWEEQLVDAAPLPYLFFADVQR